MIPALVYLLIGCLAARSRVVDIAADADRSGDLVLTAAKWVLTWPVWICR